jgi:molybdopterin converting factor small subunit
MKVLIDANFVIPGLEGKNEIEISSAEVTLKTVLEELSSMSSRRMNFIDRWTREIDYLSYHITVNEESPSALEAFSDRPLKDGDRVTIRLLGLCGG